MSLSHALAAALTGLNASARGADVVSNNLANIRTEGYGRREIALTATYPGGVDVAGVARMTDRVTLADRRLAQAESAQGTTLADFFRRIENAVGTPGSGGSLNDRIAAFETALISASGSPESTAALDQVIARADMLVQHLRAASSSVQNERVMAENMISSDVERLNAALAEVAELNGLIRRNPNAPAALALNDQRQQIIDRIAEIVPLREIDRGNGQIALYTMGGAALVEGRPSVLAFAPVGVIVPEMTVGSGALTGLTLNGRPVDALGPYAAMGGGRLAAAFTIRDAAAPDAQIRLDAVARDLLGRLSAADTTLAPGDPGLLTDLGAAFDPATESGLAGRLQINAGANPDTGGSLWRLRSGLGSATPGPAGDGTILAALAQSLTASTVTASGGFAPGNRSLSGLAGEVVSSLASSRLTGESRAGFAQARTEALRQIEGKGGVDTDRELQLLLQIERAYAANAQVIATVDRMLDDLMRIKR